MEYLAYIIKSSVFILWLLSVMVIVSSVEIGEDTPIEPEGQKWINSLFYLPKEVRTRKEYRMLTEDERKNFHTALVKMKQDKSVGPNKFDLLVSLHGRRSSRNSGHKGTGFFSWHRVYILLMENALREQVPGVTLPYWDCTLDDVLPRPWLSSIWSEDFLGNGDGYVVTGSFKSWSTVQGSLFRTIGATDDLLADKNLTRLFNHTHVSKISLPLTSYKDFEDIVEETHNRVHRWVGGEMRMIETAAQDPIFYLYHPFIDLIYELFRQHQRANGVDPEEDWDLYYGQTRHHRYSPMGLGRLMASDGASEIFAENIRYTTRPTCSRQQTDCQSPLLYCNVTVEKCVPWTIKEYTQIKKTAGIKFMPFEFEAKQVIQKKIVEGFVELKKPKTTTILTTSAITPTATDNPIIDHPTDHDHIYQNSASEDLDDGIHDHNKHKHFHKHVVSFLKEYLTLLILAGLLIVRVLMCVCSKCCSEKKVRVKRTSRKYKIKGIDNMNYKEDNNKTTDGEASVSRPDNIYTISETRHDTSTLGQTTYVRFSRYIIGSEKKGDRNGKGTQENASKGKRVEFKNVNGEDSPRHDNRYTKNSNKATSQRNNMNTDRGKASEIESRDVNNRPITAPADDYMDMTFATEMTFETHILQSERQLPSSDIFERETNTSDIGIGDDDSEGRLNSIENDNFELPLRATEDSFAFLDDYDNIDFIREAMCQDIMTEECFINNTVENDSDTNIGESSSSGISEHI